VQEAMMRRRALGARVARLATISPAGDPHIVPVCFHLDGDRLVTAVDDKPKTTTRLQRLENVRTNGRASVLVDHWSEDWDELWWVRGDGAARVVEDGLELEAIHTALAAKYRNQYGISAPTGPGIVVDVERWVGWSAAS
jgi:PPOX class probable F420-dependent enzyme